MDPSDGEPVPQVLVLCTGNAARSVMAGFMLEHLVRSSGSGLRIATAGTHAVDGQPMGRRTRAGLAAVDQLDDLAVSAHRSRQVVAGDLESAALVIAMETAHVRYVRRAHPGAAGRAATLRHLCRVLPPPPGHLVDRVASLGLEAAPLSTDDDVADPAGLEEEAYVDCALELWDLCQALFRRL